MNISWGVHHDPTGGCQRVTIFLAPPGVVSGPDLELVHLGFASDPAGGR